MSLCDEDNEKRQRQLNFIGKQFISLDAGPHGTMEGVIPPKVKRQLSTSTSEAEVCTDG